MTIELVDHFPSLSSLTGMTFLGSFAWTSSSSKQKWIKSNFAENIGAGWVTPSDIARDYLSIKFGDTRQRCNSKQWAELVAKKKHQPIYANPMSFGNASYLDLQSAYWQILQVGGWDVEYMPKRFLSPRSDVTDFPAPHIKLARNCLVSMGLPSGVNVWIPEQGFQRKRPYKPNVNLILWSFVQDVLHGIAYDMITKAEAIYVNTDGYIVPDYRMKQAAQVADDWGVSMLIKHYGAGTVRGAGDYDIGGRVSSRYRTYPKAHAYIKPREVDWLRKKFKAFSHRIHLETKPDATPLSMS